LFSAAGALALGLAGAPLFQRDIWLLAERTEMDKALTQEMQYVIVFFFCFNKPNRRVSHLPRSISEIKLSERSSPRRQVYSFI